MFRFDTRISSAVQAPGPNQPGLGPLDVDEIERLERYWRAANYLTIGQIYLQANALLREPLKVEHIKPRLLGHWGTSPGLSFVYAHVSRLIRERDVNAIYLAGPGHGGPAVLANVYLEGTYSEIYPKITRDAEGMRRLFRQFSTPGGVPSHVSVPTPGSIHEGGELGYVLMHAFGAVFDNPDLLAIAVVGDGEFETGPLAGSWKSIRFLNAARDGAVLPVLHLNGYKIANPTVPGRALDEDLNNLFFGWGYEPYFVEGDTPALMHQAFAAALYACHDQILQLQAEARRGRGGVRAARWPVLILRSPKGWTGPKEWQGLPIEGTFRAHQVPLAAVRSDPAQLRGLEAWLRSYRPDELFGSDGAPAADIRSAAPNGDRRMSANPHANGGRVLRDLDLPQHKEYAVPVPRPAAERLESTRRLGVYLRDVFARNADNFRLFCPDELHSNRLEAVLERVDRCFTGRTIAIDDHLSPDGRVFEVLSEHLCEGWLEGYLLSGRHGLFVSYEAFAMIAASMIVQHSKWLEGARPLAWRAPVASLNILLTSTCWRNDHNGFSHQGPGLIDVMLTKRGTVSRIYLPPDANCLLSIADHCLRTRNYVNLIVIDKQPQLQWLDSAAAEEHCRLGASVWAWAGSPQGQDDPDVVLASAGDIPTMETIAAAEWLRRRAPELRVRVVNVVDLMALFIPEEHPHGMSPERFVELFTVSKPVVFAFHGYRGAVHEIVHGRPNDDRFHVRGFIEQGTTTTPFDMVVLNQMSRYHLAAEALRRAMPAGERRDALVAECKQAVEDAVAYAEQHFEDLPEIRDWTWPAG
ncbi:MAG TPA: phosphoketolase family protein [Gammaproteobacteria bacterium]|nr:phosphoketolase family protein [Gammaproteobacteria bacterium]